MTEAAIVTEPQAEHSDAKMEMILWCVSYLWRKGHGPAGAELLKVVPREYAEKVMAEAL